MTEDLTFAALKYRHYGPMPFGAYAEIRHTEYWLNDARLLHRTDGPALIADNGDKYWYISGYLHRTDGPAIDCANGYKAWYINGKVVDPEQTQDK